jgi:hypothetical protein
LFLHGCSEEEEYFRRAQAAARFLCDQAWDGNALPFETGSSDGSFSYFFDCGIVVRGLVAAWHAIRDPEILRVAAALGHAMAEDFAAGGPVYHPVLALPEKKAVAYDPLRWSRAPGCYQLKSALAWWDLGQATSDARFYALYDRALETALQEYGGFLPGHPDRLKVVDRLHAFLYFLEGLLPRAAEKCCAAALCHGIKLVAHYLAETAPEFERSDVYAQLLRIRVYADWCGVVPMDVQAALQEASLLSEFQIVSTDPRTDGGFYFGRRGAEWLPHINPVSTGFALQALALWDRHQSGGGPTDVRQLI